MPFPLIVPPLESKVSNLGKLSFVPWEKSFPTLKEFWKVNKSTRLPTGGGYAFALAEPSSRGTKKASPLSELKSDAYRGDYISLWKSVRRGYLR